MEHNIFITHVVLAYLWQFLFQYMWLNILELRENKICYLFYFITLLISDNKWNILCKLIQDLIGGLERIQKNKGEMGKSRGVTWFQMWFYFYLGVSLRDFAGFNTLRLFIEWADIQTKAFTLSNILYFNSASFFTWVFCFHLVGIHDYFWKLTDSFQKVGCLI